VKVYELEEGASKAYKVEGSIKSKESARTKANRDNVFKNL
jgi:hypothetical protein